MNDLRQALLSGEEIIFETRKHWLAPVRDSLIAVLLIVGAFLLWWLAPAGGEGFLAGLGGFFGDLMWWIGLGMLVVGVVWIVGNIVSWLSANYGVSNMRVLCYEGILRKRSSETLLSSVSDVKLNIPALGGMLGYGDLTILTASGTEGSDKFTTIRRAADFRTALQSAQTGAGSAAKTATPAPPPAASAAPSPVVQDTSTPDAGPPSPATADDAAASLERLADLHTRGVITDAEFEAKKAELLGRI